MRVPIEEQTKAKVVDISDLFVNVANIKPATIPTRQQNMTCRSIAIALLSFFDSENFFIITVYMSKPIDIKKSFVSIRVPFLSVL